MVKNVLFSFSSALLFTSYRWLVISSSIACHYYSFPLQIYSCFVVLMFGSDLPIWNKMHSLSHYRIKYVVVVRCIGLLQCCKEIYEIGTTAFARLESNANSTWYCCCSSSFGIKCHNKQRIRLIIANGLHIRFMYFIG